MKNKELRLAKIDGKDNATDLFTKHLGQARTQRLLRAVSTGVGLGCSGCAGH